WTLTARRLGSEDVLTIATGSQGVDGGVLARWDSSDIVGGVYELSLELMDAYLGSISETIMIALPEQPSVSGLESETAESE
ncbi:MAG: hypothetical protein OXH40_03330, partial [Chloroflexi bacterium]|nr:hypothetical protein [Chloroflexota bacterium]